MLRDSRSYETQIIEAVRSVNKALGGSYGTSSAIYKNEFNQYEVQLIDAIKGIGRTLSGKGLSVVGGFGGEVSAEEFQDLSRRVTKLENESFFRLVDGNVTLKEQYENLWVPGWLAAGGIGSGSGGGGATFLSQLEDVSIDTTTLADGHILTWDASAGENGMWVNEPNSGGGGYVLPIASSSTLGGIKVGSGLSISSSGVLSVTGGGSVTGYIGTTQVQSSSAAQALTGILSVKASSATSSLMEWDSTNNAWHFYGNVYADGWMAAGGVGSGGSSGGSVVAISNLLSSGTRVATITIDGTDYNILAPSGGGSGSVTSVAMTVPTGLSVSGSPITSSGTLAVSLASGYVIPQQSTLDNFVTLDGTQTITGAKTFTAPVSVDPSGNASSYIDIGNARLVYDSGANALHITKKSGASGTIGLFADGFVAAGGIAGQTTASYVDLESNQTIGGNKTFTGTTTLGNVTGPITLSGALNGLSIIKDSNNYVSLRASRIDIQDNGNNLFLCRGGGKVFLCANPGGTVSQKLYLDSSSTAIAQAWNTHSDIRLKEDIETVSKAEAIEKVMALNPVTWKWKSGGLAAGLIAQEVESVIPFMVTDGEYKGLAYQMLHAYEVSAIQSHEVRIRELEKENKHLREEISRLNS